MKEDDWKNVNKEDNVYAKQIWNEAIEAAARACKEIDTRNIDNDYIEEWLRCKINENILKLLK
jgi:hypothetical protein